jgi:hypothetical protein
VRLGEVDRREVYLAYSFGVSRYGAGLGSALVRTSWRRVSQRQEWRSGQGGMSHGEMKGLLLYNSLFS